MARLRHRESASRERSAIVYCRVSTRGQEEEGTSLESQADACARHAEGLGYAVGRITKEVYTGIELWDRPLLSRDRVDLKAGAFQALICYATDRLSRDPIHLAIVAEECERAGAELVFVTEPLDTSPEAALIRYVKGYAAKMEHAKIRERTLRGKRARAESGRLLNAGTDLYGYEKDRSNGTRTIHDSEATVVRQVFRWVADEGVPIREVMRRLNTTGVPPPSGRKFSYADPDRQPRWGKGALHRLLRDPAYKGEAYAWRWTGQKRVNGHVYQRAIRDESEWIALPEGNTPALVQPDQWDAVQRRLDTNRGEATRNESRPYLLRGFIWCSRCGLRMRPTPEHGRRVYRCASRDTPAGRCGASRVAADLVETEVWAAVDQRLRDPSLIAREAKAAQKKAPDELAASDLQAARRTLAKLDQQQERLVARYRTSDNDSFPWELVEREITQVEREKKDLRATIADLEGRLAAKQAAAARLDALSVYCARVARKLATFGFDEKRLAFDAFRIRVLADGRNWEMQGEIALQGGITSQSCSDTGPNACIQFHVAQPTARSA